MTLVAQTVQTLRLDAIAADLVTALRERGIEPVLLKGPALARRLYRPELRPYTDIDLLVAPNEQESAGTLLRAEGFVEVLPGREARFGPLHAVGWWRRRDGARVDIHRTFHGVGAAPVDFVTAVRRGAARLELAGTPVAIPGDGALALIVALHAAAHGPRLPKTASDLERALDRLSLAAWQEAASLAHELDALTFFCAGLGSLAAGRARAAELGVVSPATVATILRRTGAPRGALTIDRFVSGSAGPRAGYLLETLFPSAAHLRSASPLARRGGVALAAAYAARPAVLAARLPRGFAAWLHAWHAAR